MFKTELTYVQYDMIFLSNFPENGGAKLEKAHLNKIRKLPKKRKGNNQKMTCKYVFSNVNKMGEELHLYSRVKH